jgi:hypothetical protein
MRLQPPRTEEEEIDEAKERDGDAIVGFGTDPLLCALVDGGVDFVVFHHVLEGASERPGDVRLIVQVMASFSEQNLARLLDALAPLKPRAGPDVPFIASPKRLMPLEELSILTDHAWIDVFRIRGALTDYSAVRAGAWIKNIDGREVPHASPQSAIKSMF